MRRGRVFGGLALAAVLAGCASGGGSARVDMVKMCEAHGGTWSQAQETCAMGPSEAGRSVKQAKDICAYQAGTYLPGGTCIFPGR